MNIDAILYYLIIKNKIHSWKKNGNIEMTSYIKIKLNVSYPNTKSGKSLHFLKQRIQEQHVILDNKKHFVEMQKVQTVKYKKKKRYHQYLECSSKISCGRQKTLIDIREIHNTQI